jgi:secreted trypsin-like serine protease
MANDLCREVYSVLLPGNPLSSSCMCTLIQQNSGNVCNADSGGPAAIVNADGTRLLVGVLAWGLGPCNNPDHPSVWSAIAPARGWIDNIMQTNTPA